MSRLLLDLEVRDLISEPKQLPENWSTRLAPKVKSKVQYDERQLEVVGNGGHAFRIVIRRNRQNLLDFSVILMFEDEDGAEYRLTRYNGRHSSRHTNQWENRRSLPNSWFNPAFHIHVMTERYQMDALAADGYAETTESYSDFTSALQAFLAGCNFEEPPSPQGRLL